MFNLVALDRTKFADITMTMTRKTRYKVGPQEIFISYKNLIYKFVSFNFDIYKRISLLKTTSVKFAVKKLVFANLRRCMYLKLADRKK